MKDRAYGIAINPKYDRYQRGLATMVYNFFCVKEELVQELHKPVIKKFKRRKVYRRFADNVWAADLSEMVLLSFKNRGVKYLLCMIDAWVKSLKDKRSKTVLNGFIEMLNKCRRQPNKLWFDQEREFYNSPMQILSDDNDILMYSPRNEDNSVVVREILSGT